MNFERLERIDEYDRYTDFAFKKAKERALQLNNTLKTKEPVQKARIIVKERMLCIDDALNKIAKRIESSYPSYESLPVFYQELMKCFFEPAQYRTAASSLTWASERVSELRKESLDKIKTAKTKGEINKIRANFYGKSASFLRQVRKQLEFLEQARKTMKSFPDIKEGLFTVVITGFPNAGKSTLLKRLTGSNVEINSYPFTTKRLLCGNIEEGLLKVQMIDAPGSLNRKKKNQIEVQAEVALTHAAQLVVFVFDLTEEYPIEDQKKLYRKTLRLGKQVLVYFSKPDIIGEGKIKEFIKSEKLSKKGTFYDVNSLRERIVEIARKSQKKPKEHKKNIG
ncbi:MAG TPA: GTP-binding protein [Candidatus Woesearchaeota archaeon]|nr:GTP-binding protein [Candidatus Woesearchaeota archaeon]